MADLYLLKFNGDELTPYPSSCLKPWACSCTEIEPSCGLTPQEIKAQLSIYYKDKADHIASLTPNQLMVELGFYNYT